MQTCGSLIYRGPLVSSTNKIAIPLSSTFSVDAVFSVLLKKVHPPSFSKGEERLPQPSTREGLLEMSKSGTLFAFQDEVMGPEHSGDMPQSPWHPGVDLSINKPGTS